jgi:predicted house-cleaning noncanonical NTP pyrophosphatase (MazG superfamily)
MKTLTFKLNKLVRDKIVEMNISYGGKVDYKELKGRQLTNALVDKLIEEAQELKNGDLSADELADIKEILTALRENLKISPSELEALRRKKAAANGRFKKGHYVKQLTLPADHKWANYYAADPARFPEAKNN